MATIRVKSLVWFVSGAMLATAIMLMFFNAWRVDAAPGDSDATFVPITPCRLVDTRQAGEVVFGSGETRTLNAHGTNGECTIPADAVGLSMNVTALDATAVGAFLTIWPDGAPRPDASSLNPSPGQPPIPNAVTTSISSAGKFNVFNFSGTVQVIVDINGFYTKTSLQDLTSRLAAVESDVATNTADIAGLDAREPFAVTTRDDNELITTAEVVVSISVTAPVAGQVTVNSTTNVFEADDGEAVQCTITSSAGIDFAYLQGWRSPGPGAPLTQLAGTRVFDIAANATGTYNLVCQNTTLDQSELGPSVLTAIYTPAP